MRAGEGSRLKALTSPRARLPMRPTNIAMTPSPRVVSSMLVTRFQEMAPVPRMMANMPAVRMMTSS